MRDADKKAPRQSAELKRSEAKGGRLIFS